MGNYQRRPILKSVFFHFQDRFQKLRIVELFEKCVHDVSRKEMVVVEDGHIDDNKNT